jgi:hypothetical protein
MENTIFVKGYGTLKISHAQALLNGEGSTYRAEYADSVMVHIAGGQPLSTFSAIAAVDPATVREWKRDRADFRLGVELGQAQFDYQMTQLTMDRIHAGDTKLLELWLKSHTSDWDAPDDTTTINLAVQHTTKAIEAMTMSELQEVYDSTLEHAPASTQRTPDEIAQDL